MGMKKNGKSFLAKTVALSMVVSMAPMGTAFAASNDIGGHWAESTIASWQDKGMIGGYEDGSFKPDKAITRAEFVRLINQALGFSEKGNVNFSDVSESDWYYNDVAIAMGKQYCSGFPDGTFQPNAPVTRAQAAGFVANAKNLTANAQVAGSLSDSSSLADWAKGSVGAVIGAGYMSGYPDGSFQGDKVFTRAEAVSTLDRVINGGAASPKTDDTTAVEREENDSTGQQATAPKSGAGHSSGGGGSHSSGGGGGSSSSDSYKNVQLTSANAVDYVGKTLTGTTTILVGSSDVILDNIDISGDVEVKAESNVKKAADTTLPSAHLIFRGTSRIQGNATVNAEVTIMANSASNSIARLITTVKTAIAGSLRVSRVQAEAPTIVAEGAIVADVTTTSSAPLTVTDDAQVTGTIEAQAPVVAEANTTVNIINVVAGTNASVDVQGGVSKIETSGTGTVSEIKIGGESKPEVTINKGATVEKVAVTGSAKPNVTLAEGSKTTEIEITGSSAPTINTEKGSEIKDVSVDSTEKTEINGSGEITGGVTATDESKIKVSDTVSGNTEVAERTVSSIVVKTPPAKMAYTVGDALDLSGLVITVTYSDDYTIDIPFTEFGDRVTTTPKNGDTLTAENNNKPVTISMYGKSGATGNLTVTGGKDETTAPSISIDGTPKIGDTKITIKGSNFKEDLTIEDFTFGGISSEKATAVKWVDASTIDVTTTALAAGDEISIQAKASAFTSASAASNAVTVKIKNTVVTHTGVDVNGYKVTDATNTIAVEIPRSMVLADITAEKVKVITTDENATVAVTKDETASTATSLVFKAVVTAEDGVTKSGEITITVTQNANFDTNTAVSKITVAGIVATASDTSYSVEIPHTKDIATLTAADFVIELASPVSKISKELANDNGTWKFTVTAEDDKTTADYTITVTQEQKKTINTAPAVTKNNITATPTFKINGEIATKLEAYEGDVITVSVALTGNATDTAVHTINVTGTGVTLTSPETTPTVKILKGAKVPTEQATIEFTFKMPKAAIANLTIENTSVAAQIDATATVASGKDSKVSIDGTSVSVSEGLTVKELIDALDTAKKQSFKVTNSGSIDKSDNDVLVTSDKLIVTAEDEVTKKDDYTITVVTAPIFNTDLDDKTPIEYKIDDTSVTDLTIAVDSDINVTYQWYSNTTNSVEGATEINNEKSATYTPDVTAAGTTYYFCKATKTSGSVTAVATSKIATVKVSIGAVEISGLVAPVKEATPIGSDDLSSTDKTNFEITSLAWTPEITENKFASSETYTAIITLTAKEGATFAANIAADSVTVNDKSDAKTSGIVTPKLNEDNTVLTIEVKFAAIAS